MKWCITDEAGSVTMSGECPDGTPPAAFAHMGGTLHIAPPDGVEPGWIVADGVFSIPAKVEPVEVVTAAQIIAQYTAAAQARLESVARSWRYDSVISIVGYASSGVPQFKADADAFIAWRDSFWVAANAIKISVENGSAMPSSAAAFVAMLPAPPEKPVI